MEFGLDFPITSIEPTTPKTWSITLDVSKYVRLHECRKKNKNLVRRLTYKRKYRKSLLSSMVKIVQTAELVHRLNRDRFVK